MNIRACDKLHRRPLTETWFRAIRLKHWKSRLSSDHTASIQSRFQSASPSTSPKRLIYFGQTHQVAIHEVGALTGDPATPIANPEGAWIIMNLEIILDQIVDLTDFSQLKVLRASRAELTGNWFNDPEITPTQRLGDALAELPDLEGFLYPSAKVGSNCLAIFPDKLGSRSRIGFLNELTGRNERMT